MNSKERRMALGYAKRRYCDRSDNNVEIDDHESPQCFAEAPGGVWVRAWLWVPDENYKEKSDAKRNQD